MKLNFNNFDESQNFQNQSQGTFDVSVVLPNELMDFIKSMEMTQSTEEIVEKICPNCGTSLTDIREHLMAGCEVCYQFFRNEISEEMKKRNLFPSLYQKDELSELMRKYKIAIATENYEEAMRLKEQIDGVKL